MTDFNDNTDTTAQIAKRVILKMTEWEVPLTPENYKVWYEYFVGSDDGLTAHLDEIIASGRAFDRETKALHKSKKSSEGS